MKKVILSLFTLMVIASTSVFAQKTHDQLEFPPINTFNMPDVTTFELRNGIKVYLVENTELPLISMTMLVRAGSFMDPADKVGLAGMTGQLIRGGGSETVSYTELNQLLEAKAASMETGFGLTSGSASMNILKEDLDELLPVFLDLIQNPAFPEDRIETVKTQMRSSILRRNDDPSGIASREFNKLIYGPNSVYARSMELADVDAITADDMRAFHEQVFVGRNMYLAVIGDFNARDMRRKIESTFAVIPAGTANQLNLPEVDYEFDSSVNFVAKNDVNQSTIYLGHIGGRRMNPDYAALQLMNNILSNGFSGRFMMEIRTNLGLAYGVGGAYQSLALYDGRFFATLSTASENTAQAVEATINEIRKMQQSGVTQKELDDAKDRIFNSLAFQYTSRASVLNERISNEYNGLPADIFNQYIEQVRGVSVEDVNRVAREYLRPDDMHVLIVGNENEMGDQLASLGEVNRIDITIPRPEAPKAESTGDAEAGRTYLRQMANAVLPGGEISSVAYEGNVQVQGLVLDSKITMTFPDGLKQELTAPQGLIVVEYAKGGGTMTMGPNSQPLPAMQVEALKKELDRHYLSVALAAETVPVEFTGLDDAGLAMLFLPDQNMTFYIDTETGLPAKLTVKEFNPMAGAEVESVTTYADWTVSDGVNMAYTAESTANGNPAGKAVITSHTVIR
jgi:predicted Zn-dependent peptidase